MKIIPVILCGGAGSRLWPVSREMHPKPFMKLPDGESLLQKAFLRGANLPAVEEIVVVTNREIFFKIENELDEVNQKKLAISYILEPFGRNTTAAIAAAALHIADTVGEEAIMLVLPADHLIVNAEKFSAAVNQALMLAQKDKLVVFGIEPTSPETAYGYIQTDGEKVLSFVEKPDLITAQEYLVAGNYLWNSGMFCFNAQTILQELKQHCPNILSNMNNCLLNSSKLNNKNSSRIELDEKTFAEVTDQSIDYAVMEKTKNIAVVPCSVGWSDVGSWRAISDLAATDEKGNSVEGNALLHNVHDCHIQSNERLVGAVGVSGLVIIDTPDALLVADRNATQDVKLLYNALKLKKDDAYKLHRTVYRPWGSYTILEEGVNFKIKNIVVKPGASLSLQMHKHRSEHWIVVKGTAKVTNGDDVFLMQVNESTFITAGNRHRLENLTEEMLILIEVQTGNYLGEDDIVRFEDKYGREANQKVT